MPVTNILVPTDFSRNAQLAFEKAVDIARQLKATLHLLHVQDESTLRIAIKEGLLREGSTDEELREEVEALTEERFSQMLSNVDVSGIELNRISLRGVADVMIFRYAAEINADLIVVGMRGAGVLGFVRNAFVGSVAESIIRKAPCPVLVVRLDH
jgi:nucleotide-binding universal stress UspA family protein